MTNFSSAGIKYKQLQRVGVVECGRGHEWAGPVLHVCMFKNFTCIYNYYF